MVLCPLLFARECRQLVQLHTLLLSRTFIGAAPTPHPLHTFPLHPQVPGTRFVFREGRTKGIGMVVGTEMGTGGPPAVAPPPISA